jgi:hypothetical protein
MAIIQSSLTEEILSRQEKAVIRGIYRAQQLSETKIALEKCKMSVVAFGAADAEIPAKYAEHYAKLLAYLESAILSALVSTKVPAVSLVVKESPSTKG